MKKIHLSSAAALVLSSSLMAQTISLNEGWNLIGISETGSSGDVLIKDTINKDKITTIYAPSVGNVNTKYIEYNTDSFVPGYGYWLKVADGTSDAQLSFTGVSATVDYTKVITNPGWNLIAFSQSSTLKETVATLTTKGFKTSTIYSPSVGNVNVKYIEYNNDSTNPNIGYYFKVQSEVESITDTKYNIKVQVFSDTTFTGTKPTITVDSSTGNVSLSGLSGLSGSVSVSTYDGSKYVEVVNQSITSTDITKSLTNGTDFEASSQAVSTTSYAVYYAKAGSAPIALTNVEVYDNSGKYIGKTDANGKISVSTAASSIKFVKEGYATISTEIDKTSTTGSIFMTMANKATATSISTGTSTTATARPFTRLLYNTNAEQTTKTMQNSDGSFKATFSGFEISDDSKSVKLALIDPKNIQLDNNQTNIAAFALELVTSEDGIEKQLGVKPYTDLDTNSATSPKVTFEIKLDNTQKELASKALSTKAAAENKMKLYGFDGTDFTEVTDANITLSDTTLKIEGTSNFTGYVAAFKSSETPKDYNITIVDQNGDSVADADIMVMDKPFYDVNGSFTFKGIIPKSGIVDVEVFAEGYEYLQKSIKLSSDTTIKLKKQSADDAIDYTLSVKDSSDSSAIKNAKVKIEVPVVLSSITKKDGSIFVGKAAGATYTWSIVPLDGSSEIALSDITTNSVKLTKVYEKLKTESKEIGAFDIKVKVAHKGGFEEEGVVGFLDIMIDPYKAVDFGSIQVTGFNESNYEIEQKLQDEEYMWHDGSSLSTVNWKLSYGTNSEVFEGEELIIDDIGYFMSAYSISSGAITAKIVDSDGKEKPDYSVNIPLVSEKTVDEIADIYADVFPATSVPSVIESETDDDGQLYLDIPTDLTFALSVKKGGYKSFAAKRSLKTDATSNNIDVSLAPRSKYSGFTLNITDENGTTIEPTDGNISFVITDSITKKITKNSEEIEVVRDLKHTATTQTSGGFGIDSIISSIGAESGLIEGVKSIKVFAKGYMPYDGKIRIKENNQIESIKLQELTAEQTTLADKLVKPFVDISYMDIVNDKLMIKGLVTDTSDAAKPYSGTSTLTIIFNDEAKSFPIGTDGSFSVTLTPQNGDNSLEGIVSNQKGSYNSGVQFIEYFNFGEDMTDMDQAFTDQISEFTDEIIDDTAPQFTEGSVIKSLTHMEKPIENGMFIDSVENFNAQVEIASDTNATVYYFTSTKGDTKLDGTDLNVSLEPGINTIGLVAKEKFEIPDQNILVDVVVDEFFINVFYEPSQADIDEKEASFIGVDLNLTTTLGDYTGEFDVIVEEPADEYGNPGEFKGHFMGTGGAISLAGIEAPARVVVFAEGYYDEFINITKDDANKTIEIKLYSQDAVSIGDDFLSKVDIMKSSLLMGPEYLFENEVAFYNLMINDFKIDPDLYTYVWSIGENNTTISECTSIDCEINPGYYNIPAVKTPINVTISKDGEVKGTKTRWLTIEKAPDGFSFPPEAYMPYDLYLDKDQSETFNIEIMDWDNGIASATLKVADLNNMTYDSSKIEITPAVDSSGMIDVVWGTPYGDDNNSLTGTITVTGKVPGSELLLRLDVEDKAGKTTTRETYISVYGMIDDPDDENNNGENPDNNDTDVPMPPEVPDINNNIMPPMVPSL